MGTPNDTSRVERAIRAAAFVQRYTVLPFSIFTLIHVSSVVVAPTLFGTDVANQMITMGRELYQVPLVEIGMLVSIGAHLLSGVSLNLLRRYLRYLKYGTARQRVPRGARNEYKRTDGDEVRDVDAGLGGISAFLGLGARKALSWRLLGLSPLSFSGYALTLLLAGHVYYERVEPLIVHGESGFVDLGFVSKALHEKGSTVAVSLLLLVLTASYHLSTGWNWLMGKFKPRDRMLCYCTIGILGTLAASTLSILSRTA